ncbi:hypothetical protein FS837_000923 [Tulasnella sp. UAMH 9824]|nr:hypothetical protein FS837_000923 [Tulasnella sp. UAMH 9824]
MGLKGNGPHGFFYYDASVPAAIVFAVIFAILLGLHIWQIVKYKTTFMVVIIIAVGMELLGYITRIISIKNTDALWANIVSQTTLVVAPAFLAANGKQPNDALALGSVMSFVGSEYGLINHNKITKIFVGADILEILTQAGGAALLAGAQGNVDRMKKARDLLLAGLSLQVVTFGIFVFVAIAYDWRSSRAEALKPYQSEMKNLRRLWYAFYVSALLITGRSIYRTAEFGEVSFESGHATPDGYALTHEWPLYVFDSLPIFLSVLAFNVFHPGQFLPIRKGAIIGGKLRMFNAYIRVARQQSEESKSEINLQPV